MKKKKNKKRTLAYAVILGGFTLASFSTFSVAQYERAKANAASKQQSTAEMELKRIFSKDENALTDESSAWHDPALWYNDIKEHFYEINQSSSKAYTSLSITSYALTLTALVSFGLILKDAEKQKEKEDNEAAA